MDNSLVCITDYEKYASDVLPKAIRDYYNNGAGEEYTVNLNKDSFKRWRIRPRCLRDVSNCKTTTNVLGRPLSVPIGISPTAMQKMAHPDGECASAKAAGEAGTVFTLATLSTCSIEEVSVVAPNTRKWFQLFIYKDRNVTSDLARRAEKCGFEALVLTVDAQAYGIRYCDLRNKFSPPSHLTLANFAKETKSNGTIAQTQAGWKEYVKSLFDLSVTWDDIKWLKSITKLPLILKGIVTKEDAEIAVQLGVSAILVSNHGGRHIDGTCTTIEALPEIIKAVGGRVEVYLDGGVRTGTDIFKAIALGARMVFIGRPALWGLSHSGQQGVVNILNILKEEFFTTLKLAGCNSVEDITPDMVVHKSQYKISKL